MVAHDRNDTSPSRKKPLTGVPSRPDGYKPVSSIPAKYETLLFTGPRERKGFLSEGKRFSDTETDNPGPGSYVGPQQNTLDYKHESISKRGYGAMASRDKRFDRKFRYTGPGPGEYRSQLEEMIVTFSKATASAAFHPPSQKTSASANRESATPGPGPGSYDPTGTRQGQKVEIRSAPHTHNSAFKAAGHKLTLLGNPESPAPTRYDLGDPWDPSKGGGGGVMGGMGSKAGSRAGTSSFAGRSVTSLTSVPTIIFLEDGKGGPAGAGAAKPNTGPGPGSYEVQKIASFEVSLQKAASKPSPAFQPPEYVDRFGCSLAAIPEAGPKPDYALGGHTRGGGSPDRPSAAGFTSPRKGVSAPFKSLSPGHGDYQLKEMARAPGPAYYTPKLPQKSEFHVRSKGHKKSLL